MDALRITLFLVASLFATAAHATTITLTDWDRTTVYAANPLASSTTGSVFENVTGGSCLSGDNGGCGGTSNTPARSPYDIVDGIDGPYTTISANSSATYAFGSVQSGLSFLWGSPDTYNDLIIELMGANPVMSVTITPLPGGGVGVSPGTAAVTGNFNPLARDATFFEITGVSFDSVRFTSGQNAFEFAGLTAVPAPAPLLLLGAALFGLAGVGRRRRVAVLS